MSEGVRAGSALFALPGGVVAGACTGLLYPLALLLPGLLRGDPSSSSGLLIIGLIVGLALGMLVGALTGGVAAALLALLWRGGVRPSTAAALAAVVLIIGVSALLIWLFTPEPETMALAVHVATQLAGGLILLTWWAGRAPSRGPSAIR